MLKIPQSLASSPSSLSLYLTKSVSLLSGKSTEGGREEDDKGYQGGLVAKGEKGYQGEYEAKGDKGYQGGCGSDGEKDCQYLQTN